jgi:NDP-sugar pyrophosphorylase family protein
MNLNNEQVLNIVIPMAGEGSRFKDAGFKDPKPLIKINNKYMIEVVVENIKPKTAHKFIFICQKEHYDEYNLKDVFDGMNINYLAICIEGVTEGALCTVLKAKEHINNTNPLMVANSDQWIDVNIDDYIEKSLNKDVDGMIMTMFARGKKWSYVQKENDLVIEVQEKKEISNEATVGIYNFKSGATFVQAGEDMISKELRVGGEFYLAPVYNLLISQKGRVKTFFVEKMCGLGTPEDYEAFIKSDFSNDV